MFCPFILNDLCFCGPPQWLCERKTFVQREREEKRNENKVKLGQNKICKVPLCAYLGDDAGWEISSPARFSSEKFQPLIVVDGHRADRKVCVGGRALSRVWCGDRFRFGAAKQGFRVGRLSAFPRNLSRISLEHVPLFPEKQEPFTESDRIGASAQVIRLQIDPLVIPRPVKQTVIKSLG